MLKQNTTSPKRSLTFSLFAVFELVIRKYEVINIHGSMCHSDSGDDIGWIAGSNGGNLQCLRVVAMSARVYNISTTIISLLLKVKTAEPMSMPVHKEPKP